MTESFRNLVVTFREPKHQMSGLQCRFSIQYSPALNFVLSKKCLRLFSVEHDEKARKYFGFHFQYFLLQFILYFDKSFVTLMKSRHRYRRNTLKLELYFCTHCFRNHEHCLCNFSCWALMCMLVLFSYEKSTQRSSEFIVIS